jgi:hypothetical protein
MSTHVMQAAIRYGDALWQVLRRGCRVSSYRCGLRPDGYQRFYALSALKTDMLVDATQRPIPAYRFANDLFAYIPACLWWPVRRPLRL